MPIEQQKTSDNNVAAALQSASAAISLAQQAHETYARLATDKERQAVSIALINNDIKHIKDDTSEIKVSMNEIKENYVTHVEFNDSIKLLQEQMKPIKNIVYGLVTAILLAVIYGVMELVIK